MEFWLGVGIGLHYFVFLPVVLFEDAFVLPERLVVLVQGSQEQPLGLLMLGLEYSEEGDAIGEFYLSQSNFVVRDPHTLVFPSILIDAPAVSFLASLADFPFVDLARDKDIGAISIHSIIFPVPIVEIVGVKHVHSFSVFFLVDKLAEVN